MTRAVRLERVALLLSLSLLYLAFLGARDLWNPNEPIYGQAVAEMRERGDWLVPSVNGVVFREKPPLYFWLALGGATLAGGVSEFVLRLPSALSGIGSVGMVFLLVLPDGGRRRAWIAAALFGTTYIVMWSARSIQMDLLLTACVLAAILAAVRALERRIGPVAGGLLAGLATGAGFLAKGPIAIVAAGLPVLLYAWSHGRTRELMRRLVPWGLLAGAAAVLPWIGWLVARGETEMLNEIVWRQSLMRSLDPWDHVAPWWYFLREFWMDMAPWSLFVPLALGLRGRDESSARLDRLAWVWLIGFIVVLSFSASKRSPYMLPVAPAVAILVSGVVERRLAGKLGGWRDTAFTLLVAAIATLLAAAGLALWIRVLPEYPDLSNVGAALAALLVTGGVVVAGMTVVPRSRRRVAPAGLLMFVFVFQLYAVGWVLPAADPYKSPRGFCEQVEAAAADDGVVVAYRIWQWRAGYTYYLDRPIERVSDPETLAARWSDEERLFVIVERGALEEFREVVGEVDPLLGRPIGSNFAYLFTNRPASPATRKP